MSLREDGYKFVKVEMEYAEYSSEITPAGKIADLIQSAVRNINSQDIVDRSWGWGMVQALEDMGLVKKRIRQIRDALNKARDIERIERCARELGV